MPAASDRCRCSVCRRVFRNSHCLGSHQVCHARPPRVEAARKCPAPAFSCSRCSQPVSPALIAKQRRSLASRRKQVCPTGGNTNLCASCHVLASVTAVKLAVLLDKLDAAKEAAVADSAQVSVSGGSDAQKARVALVCTHCSMKFYRKIGLHRHVQSVHLKPKNSEDNAAAKVPATNGASEPAAQASGLKPQSLSQSELAIAPAVEKQVTDSHVTDAAESKVSKSGDPLSPGNFCTRCQRSFATRSSLCRHAKRHHVSPAARGSKRAATSKAPKRRSAPSDQAEEVLAEKTPQRTAVPTEDKKTEIDFNEFLACRSEDTAAKQSQSCGPEEALKNGSLQPEITVAAAQGLARKLKRRRQCSVCGGTFSSSSSLRRHVQRLHSSQTDLASDERAPPAVAELQPAAKEAPPSPSVPDRAGNDRGGSSASSSSSLSVAASPAELSRSSSGTPTERAGISASRYLLANLLHWTPRPVFKTASVVCQGRLQVSRKRKLQQLQSPVPDGCPLRRVNSCIAQLGSSQSAPAAGVLDGVTSAASALRFLPASDAGLNPFVLPWERKRLPPDAVVSGPCCRALSGHRTAAAAADADCRLLACRLSRLGESAVLVAWQR